MSRFPPYGYAIHRGSLVPKEGEIENMKLIVEMASKGLTVNEITADMNRRGIRFRSDQWRARVVERILKREVYGT